MAKKDKTPPENEIEDAVALPVPVETPVVQDVEPVEDHEEEETHFPLAARTLQGLTILVIGAAIGIWAAPKIAPKLPAGMAPIAQWLSPSDSASSEEVALLRVEAEARLNALESLPGKDEFETRLANFQTDILNPLRSQMTALSDQVAASDSTAIESRLWALESRVEGLIVELAALTESLGTVAAEGGTISADTAASIAAYRTRIDGMQAVINDLAANQGALSQRIDESLATVDRQVQEAEAMAEEAQQGLQTSADNAEIEAALARIRTALNTGGAFDSSLDRIAAVTEVDAGLTAGQHGVATMDELRSAFIPVAHEAIRASINSDAEGSTFSALGAFVRSQVATRSLTEREGEDTDAVLSRIEAALKHDYLVAALEQATALPDAAAVEMAGWIETAQLRADALDGYDMLIMSLGMGER